MTIIKQGSAIINIREDIYRLRDHYYILFILMWLKNANWDRIIACDSWHYEIFGFKSFQNIPRNKMQHNNKQSGRQIISLSRLMIISSLASFSTTLKSLNRFSIQRSTYLQQCCRDNFIERAIAYFYCVGKQKKWIWTVVFSWLKNDFQRKFSISTTYVWCST